MSVRVAHGFEELGTNRVCERYPRPKMSSALTSALRRAAVQPKAAPFRAVTQMRTMSAQQSFQKNWLSDKGAWPVLGVISGAVVFSSFWGISTLMTNPDVRINRTMRTTVIRPGKE